MVTKSLRIILLGYLISIVLSSCAEQRTPSPYSPLSDSGIQILSGTNPYHGPNLIMARALESSPVLHGYFQHNGAPQAIEVRKAGMFKEELLFYYPKEYRVYVATRKPSDTFTDWMVAGPYGIGKHDYRRINNFIDRRKPTPVFLVHGAETRFQDHSNSAFAMPQRISFEPEIPLIAEPKPKPKPKVKKVVKKTPEIEVIVEKKSKKVTGKLPNLDDPKFIPKNADQEALLVSQGYAKRAPNGDILHDIEGNAQTLTNIAHWYMGSTKLVSELQNANNFPVNQTDARKGVVVRIPQDLIKRTKKMPMNHRAKLAAPTSQETEKAAEKKMDGDNSASAEG